MNSLTRGRNTLLSGLLFGALCLTGCMTDSDSGNDDIKISGLKANPASAKAGDKINVEGTVTSANPLTAIDITIWKGATDVTTGKGFALTGGPIGEGKKAWSLNTDGNFQFVVGGAAPTGEYTIKVKAKAGADSAEATTSFSVAGTAVATEEFTLGANKNALGGSVDLDALKVYTHSEAKDVSGTIDLYYAHTLLVDKLFTPKQAKASGYGDTSNGPATWTEANDTEFRMLTLSESAFSSISTQEAIDALWATAAPVAGGGAAVSEGATFIVNTDKAKKVLIRVTAYTEGEAGTITVKGTK